MTHQLTRCPLRLVLRSLSSVSATAKVRSRGHSIDFFKWVLLPRILGNKCSSPHPTPRHGLALHTLPLGFRGFSGSTWRIESDPRQPFHRGRRSYSQEAGGSVSETLQHKSEGELAGKNYTTIKAELVEGGSVGLIWLNRPKALNALSEALMIEVVDACQAFDGSEMVGAIVLTGKDKAFAAGADIKEMKDKSFVEAYKSQIFSHWNSLTAIRKPIIGAINGYALGGGCELALLCDILLAGEKAVFGQPEVNLGVIPGIGGTQRLIREVGKSRAMEMILTGKAFMNAEEAAQRGLVSRVIPGDNEALVAEAVSLAKSISELSRPSVAMAKEAVNAAYEIGLQDGIKLEHSLFCAAFALEDQKEGMSAFVEKRKPKFQHK
ncbi:unnamed protein product [Calypogeia fissa]